MAAETRFTLRLPADLKARADEVAGKGGVSLNTLVSHSLALYLGQYEEANAYFAARAKRGSLANAMTILEKAGSDDVSPGDELPEGLVPATRR